MKTISPKKDNIETFRLTAVRILRAKITLHQWNIPLERASKETIVQNIIPVFGNFLFMGDRSSSPFLNSVREAIRVRHYSIRTEQAYVQWIKLFILFHEKRRPNELGEHEVIAFLTHLAVVGKVSASTQNQSLNALVFRYGAPTSNFGFS